MGKKKAAGAPTPTAKLNNFNTPEGIMMLTTAVHPYMKTRAFARLSGSETYVWWECSKISARFAKKPSILPRQDFHVPE